MLMTSSVFGDEPNDDELERHRKMLVRERFYAAYDGDVPVGTAADFPFRLTVPGGELAAGGVTCVAVLPSHRRQGVLTELMRRELDDLHERGDPLAVLWASEAAIYGRFGYGMAAPHFDIDLTVRVDSRLDPASPLFLMVVDARSLQLRASEGLWLRLVDVGAALEGRSYASDDEVVVELSDAICPWNAGRWRLGRDAARTAEPSALQLDVSGPACAYPAAS